jgi:hypothetical protein
MKLSRRKFIQAGIGTGLAAPLILHAQDKAGTKAPVLGSGEFRFEWIADWGAVPSNIKWGNTHNVVEDSQGNIYVHHTVYADSESPDSMVVFDGNGKFIRSWGKEFKGVAHGMWLQKEGREEFLYLTVNAANPKVTLAAGELPATVLKATLKGEIVWKVQGPPDIDVYHVPAGTNPTLPLYNPTNLAIAPNGDVYVADGYGSYFINRYNHKGDYLSTFGGRGSDPGQLKEPHGIWVDTRTPNPILVVADRRNNRLQRFTLDGQHIDFVAGFRLPCHFHEQKGNVVIPDLQTRVTLIDKNNQIILHLGDPTPDSPPNPPRATSDRASFVPGQFVAPHGACFDHEGNIFVVEWVEMGRVTKLRKVA